MGYVPMTGADLLAIRMALILRQRASERWHKAQTLKEAMLAHMMAERAEQILQRYGGVDCGNQKGATAEGKGACSN